VQPPPVQQQPAAGYQQNPTGVAAAEQTPATQEPTTTTTEATTTTTTDEPTTKGPKWPLPSCYLNKHGFMCCSTELEDVITKTYNRLDKSRNGKWKKCNLQQIANAVQKACESHFGVPFEVISGAGDYASKINFSKDLLCKIKSDKQFITAFATPV
jgi:hypothetical protein